MFCRIHRKAPLPESLFSTLLKRDSHTFFCELCQVFINIYFVEHLRIGASMLLPFAVEYE